MKILGLEDAAFRSAAASLIARPPNSRRPSKFAGISFASRKHLQARATVTREGEFRQPDWTVEGCGWWEAISGSERLYASR